MLCRTRYVYTLSFHTRYINLHFFLNLYILVNTSIYENTLVFAGTYFDVQSILCMSVFIPVQDCFCACNGV